MPHSLPWDVASRYPSCVRGQGPGNMRWTTQNRTGEPILDSDEFVGRERDSLDGSEPCFGRGGLLSAFDELLQSSVEATKSVVIRGEPGIGKTRLVAEVAGCARQRGVRVAWGHCYGVEETHAYLPFRQVFESLCLHGPRDHERLLSAHSATTGRSELGQLLRDPGDDRRRFVTDIARPLLEEAARQRLLVVVEDIHWADVGSLLLLNSLIDLRGRGLVLVCTAREGEEPQDATRRQLLFKLEQKSRVTRLRGLGPAAVRELIRWLCGPGVGTEREVVAVRSFTGGNPLFIRALIAHLRDEGLLGRRSLGQALAESATPSRLADVLDLRIKSLSSETQSVLAVASVLGTEFSLPVLSVVSNVGAGRAADLLFEATRRGILREVDGPAMQRFRFAHSLYPKLLYESLRPSRRQALHTRIAEAADRQEIHLQADELAEHYARGLQSSRRRKAVALWQEVAERSETIFAHERAASFWRLAVEYGGHLSPRCRADLLSRLGWAYWSSRMWGQAREAWEQAVPMLEAVGDSRRVGALALAIGETARWQQELGPADRWLRRALDDLPADSEASNRALALLGSVACAQDDAACGLSLLDKARERDVSGGRTDPYVSYWLSYGYMTAGDVANARSLAREGLRLAMEAAKPEVSTLLAGHLAQIELSLLNLSSAQRCSAIVRRLVGRTDTAGLMFSLVAQCYLLAYQGRWARVATVCERGMAELRLAGRYQLSTIRFMRAEAILALGNPRAASAEMAHALPGLEAMQHAGRVHLARALVRLGALEQARELVRPYVSAEARTRRMLTTRATLGEVASQVLDETACGELYRLLTHECRPLVLQYCPAATQRVLGRLATTLGDWIGAEKHFETAIQQLSQAQATWELIQTYSDYAGMRRARRRRGDARKASALASEAERLLTGLGVPPSALACGRPSQETEVRANRFALTGREVEVLQRLAKGMRNSEIAESLGISHRTVDRHVENLLGKMGARGRVDAVLLAVQERLVG